MYQSRGWRLKAAPGGGAAKPACAGWDERAPAREAAQAALADRWPSRRVVMRQAPRQGRRFYRPARQAFAPDAAGSL